MTPGQIGLPAGRHRRVAGLRREELALLAGISVDYVVRIEQGRSTQPSAQVLTALARALRLSQDERDELFHLAGTAPPTPGTIDLHVRPSVLRLIDRFADLPVLVLSAKGDVLAWNAMASALYGDWTALRPERRNIVRLQFLPDPNDPERSRVAQSPEERANASALTVGDLRAAAARYPNDRELRRLLADLRAGSEEFTRLWDRGGASTRRSHRKTIEHPQLAPMTLDCDTLHVPDADQLVVVYSAPPGTPEHEQLALLRVIGTQNLAPTTDSAR
ncbi:Helix-turn-helix domain-containing protein [Amycolatopsis marina]|uniref:Helix-turn-helix domain-containing protein n=1 Tax=Amycolatopsis marina TaxID=490629 RepID=A0A1I1C095_9PSEU|nr:Helix-turn-helix domain-containing protein [Amycolatopsis marina]